MDHQFSRIRNQMAQKREFEDKDIFDVYSLNEEYLKQHPKAEPLLSLLNSHGVEGIFELHKEANGRKIVIKSGPGEDEVHTSFR
jgi:hypothetical protein